MKQKLLLIISGLFLATSVSAQLGSTPENGHNPVAPANARTGDPNPTPQDGNAALGPVYQADACGLNFVTSSLKLGQRFAPAGSPQPASFPVAGISSGCNTSAPPNILKAYLWAGTSGNGAAMTVSITNPLGTTLAFPMQVVGSDIDKCWGYGGTHTYRADVTSIISGNGNYVMSGFLTNPPTSGNDCDGATLMIIYADPQATYTGSIDVWDGTVVINGGTTTQTPNDFNACMAGSNAKAFGCIADLQGLGTQMTFNGNGPFTTTEDWWNYIEVPTTITAGQTSAAFNVNSPGDCFNFCMAGVYFQTPCLTCVPAASYTTTMSSTPSMCTGNTGTATVVINGGTGPFTYSWSPSGQTTSTATGLAPGLYTVTITDASGCQSQDTVSVMGTGSLQLGATQTNVTCNAGSDGTANVIPIGGSGPYTYTWAPNTSTQPTAVNLSAGTYTVNVSDNFGCASSFTFTITEPPLVPIVATGSGPVAICIGASATISVSATGGGAPPYTYLWLNNLSTNDTITVSPVVTTTYSVVVTDNCNTPPDTGTVTVTVNPLPVITISGDNVDGCAPLCVNFTETSVPASNDCSWNFGEDASVAAGCVQSNCYEVPGSYTVTLTVTDINGCINTLVSPNFITVYPDPVANFNIISPQPATLSEAMISFDDLSNGGDTCIWDYGDGNIDTVLNCGDVAHNYSNTGVYGVKQVVVNQWGCRDTINSEVVIIPKTTLYVPNTFTPNGDGKNDVFFAYGEFVSDFHMMIFDRWGNLIFESSDMTEGWNGTANGGKDLVQIDTYVWVITYTEKYEGYKHKIVGHVNMLH